MDKAGVSGGLVLMTSRSGGIIGKIKLQGGPFSSKAGVPDCSSLRMDAMPIPGITGVADLPRLLADWTWAGACFNARGRNGSDPRIMRS